MTFLIVFLKIEPIKKSQIYKTIFVEARAFIKIAKEGTSFFIYATWTCDNVTSLTNIPK